MSWNRDREKELWPAFEEEHVQRLYKAIRNPRDGDLTHAWVNLFVEGARTFPYQLGHYLGIIIPVQALITAAAAAHAYIALSNW